MSSRTVGVELPPAHRMIVTRTCRLPYTISSVLIRVAPCSDRLCGKWSRTVGVQILPPTQLVPAPWSSGTSKCRRLVPTPYSLAQDSEIKRVASFHVSYHALPCDSLAKHLDPAKRRINSSLELSAEEQFPSTNPSLFRVGGSGDVPLRVLSRSDSSSGLLSISNHA